MPDSAVMAPVPFYPPVRTDTGKAGSHLNLSHHARSIPRLIHSQRPVNEDAPAGPVYDRLGQCHSRPWIGRVLNIWA